MVISFRRQSREAVGLLDGLQKLIFIKKARKWSGRRPGKRVSTERWSGNKDNEIPLANFHKYLAHIAHSILEMMDGRIQKGGSCQQPVSECQKPPIQCIATIKQTSKYLCLQHIQSPLEVIFRRIFPSHFPASLDGPCQVAQALSRDRVAFLDIFQTR